MRRIDLESLPWEQPAEGVRAKSVDIDHRRIRFIEFAPGVTDPDWCAKAHVGYLLSGSLEIEFEDGTEVFAPGNVLAIAAGDMHRAKVVEGPVRLFLVDERVTSD
jgi:quercetin dioxygenase-like cupin family protein